jgi:hypothetical protein
MIYAILAYSLFIVAAAVSIRVIVSPMVRHRRIVKRRLAEIRNRHG